MRNLPQSVLSALPRTCNLAPLEDAFNARRRNLATLVQPSMSWADGPRTQPRDGRGRFLPRTWLADAELFLPSDRAWFRSPIASQEG